MAIFGQESVAWLAVTLQTALVHYPLQRGPGRFAELTPNRTSSWPYMVLSSAPDVGSCICNCSVTNVLPLKLPYYYHFTTIYLSLSNFLGNLGLFNNCYVFLLIFYRWLFIQNLGENRFVFWQYPPKAPASTGTSYFKPPGEPSSWRSNYDYN